MNFSNLFDLTNSLTFYSITSYDNWAADRGGDWWHVNPYLSILCVLSTEFLGNIFLIAQASGKLEEALEKGLRIISLFAFIIATIVVMYGGYQIRTGNAEAGKMSILGGLVIGLAVVIVTSIFDIAGLPVLKIGK